MRPKRVISPVLCLALCVSLCGCGSIFYPERHGQRQGRIDPAGVLFDGALLLFYVIPGLVAFGIDFHTGAIYLPSRRRRAESYNVLTHARIRDIVRAASTEELHARVSALSPDAPSLGALE